MEVVDIGFVHCQLITPNIFNDPIFGFIMHVVADVFTRFDGQIGNILNKLAKISEEAAKELAGACGASVMILS